MDETGSGGDGLTTISKEESREGKAPVMALRVISSPEASLAGRFYRLDRSSVEIGRMVAGTEICLPERALSRRHARIQRGRGRHPHLLEDLGSRNGTFLNGLEVRRERLRSGDLLRVGDTVLAYVPLDLKLMGWRPEPASGMVGWSSSLKSLLERADRVAPTDMTVMLLGETGVGKELLARYIHEHSGLSGPLVPVNCATLSPELAASELFGHVRGAYSGAERAHVGLLTSATGGTFFMDEVGELAPEVQAKLLRAIEEQAVRPVGALRPVEARVRVVCATNADLRHAVRQGRFRADLMARIAQWELQIPPLRERREDIPLLAEHFLEIHSPDGAHRLTADLAEALCLHHWPLNVRELSTVIRGMVVDRPEGGPLGPRDLPQEMITRLGKRRAGESPADTAVPLSAEGTPGREELDELLRSYGGCIADVARHLDRGRMQIYRWMKRHGLKPEMYRR